MGVNRARTHDPRTVRVDIGELVLDGFDARLDSERLTAAFHTELARLVRERGVPLASDGEARTVASLGGLPPLPATVSPGRLGAALAHAVHAGLSGDGEPGPAPEPGSGRRR